MNAFIVQIPHRAGEMARLTDVLANRGINILVYGLGAGNQGIAGFFTANEPETRTALDEAGVDYQEIPAIAVRMEDRPGQATSISKQLADAGLNIHLWLPVDSDPAQFTVIIGVDDIDAAQRVIGDQVVEWSYS